jgi:hypothetical protein
MHNPRVTRLFLWNNKSVFIREINLLTVLGKKTQYSKQMMTIRSIKTDGGFINSNSCFKKCFFLNYIKIILKKLFLT